MTMMSGLVTKAHYFILSEYKYNTEVRHWQTEYWLFHTDETKRLGDLFTDVLVDWLSSEDTADAFGTTPKNHVFPWRSVCRTAIVTHLDQMLSSYHTNEEITMTIESRFGDKTTSLTVTQDDRLEQVDLS